MTALPRFPLPAILGFAGLMAWAFFPTLDWMVEKWIHDSQYSHGFLVPFVSAYLIYRKWDQRHTWIGQPLPVLAGVILAGAVGLRFLGGGLLFHQLDMLAFLVSIAALVLCAGGWALLKAAGPALIFLIFMVPLPYEIERNVGGPLRLIATQSCIFTLQTLGYPAVQEGGVGNVILIDDIRMNVVDACSGLKMLLTFSCFGVGAMLLLDRTWFEKFLIFLGIVPIALIANVVRITATGIAMTMTDKSMHQPIHDGFGYPMMLVGLALLALELWILGRLVVRTPPEPAPMLTYGVQPRYA